jgi:hypothetical protein
MTQRRGTAIKQCAVLEVMARLSELPDRGKDPGTSVSLGKIFRAKEYFNEIKTALKKGYTFDDLASIFTEKCGVEVSARQLKYHYTREKNRRSKNNAGRKQKQQDSSNTLKGGVPLEHHTQTCSAVDTGTAANVQAIPTISAPKPAAFVTSNSVTYPDEIGAGTGTFHFGKRRLNE